MSDDDVLILKRHPDKDTTYSLWYQESRIRAKKLLEGNSIQHMLQAAEERQPGVGYNVRLEGWVESGKD